MSSTTALAEGTTPPLPPSGRPQAQPTPPIDQRTKLCAIPIILSLGWLWCAGTALAAQCMHAAFATAIVALWGSMTVAAFVYLAPLVILIVAAIAMYCISKKSASTQHAQKLTENATSPSTPPQSASDLAPSSRSSTDTPSTGSDSEPQLSPSDVTPPSSPPTSPRLAPSTPQAASSSSTQTFAPPTGPADNNPIDESDKDEGAYDPMSPEEREKTRDEGFSDKITSESHRSSMHASSRQIDPKKVLSTQSSLKQILSPNAIPALPQKEFNRLIATFQKDNLTQFDLDMKRMTPDDPIKICHKIKGRTQVLYAPQTQTTQAAEFEQKPSQVTAALSQLANRDPNLLSILQGIVCQKLYIELGDFITQAISRIQKDDDLLLNFRRSGLSIEKTDDGKFIIKANYAINMMDYSAKLATATTSLDLKQAGSGSAFIGNTTVQFELTQDKGDWKLGPPSFTPLVTTTQTQGLSPLTRLWRSFT